MELNKLNIEIKGEVLLGDTKIKYVEGGFGEDQKSILASDVAKLCNKRTKHVQKLITNNIHRFNNNDLIDLCNENLKVQAKHLGLITSNAKGSYCKTNKFDEEWPKIREEYYKLLDD